MSQELSFEQNLAAEIEGCLAASTDTNTEKLYVVRYVPDLYHFLWRLSFDTSLPGAARHYAASLAFYIMSPVDYMAQEVDTPLGYLDDLAVAVRGISRLLERVDEETLLPHWKGSAPLSRVITESEAVATELLPTLVAEKVDAYLEW